MTNIKAFTTDDGRLVESSELTGLVIICFPSVIERKVELQRCPTCKKDQAFFIEVLAWYGSDATCLGCGERWNDGEMCPRPFARGMA